MEKQKIKASIRGSEKGKRRHEAVDEKEPVCDFWSLKLCSIKHCRKGQFARAIKDIYAYCGVPPEPLCFLF